MAITSYSELVSTLQTWMARSDLGGAAPDFITLGENYLNYGGDPDTDPPLRCREMEVVASLPVVGGVAAVPDDYLEYRRVVETAVPRRTLKYGTPDAVDLYYPSGAAGLATHFTIIGTNLNTYPSASNTLEFTYYQRIPPLTEDDPTNWLLAKSPSVYLRAALLQAADYTRKTEEIAKHATMLRGMVAGLNHTNMMGNYARAGVTLRGATP